VHAAGAIRCMASAAPSPGMEAVWEVGRKARESGRLLAALPVEDRNKVDSLPPPRSKPLIAVFVEATRSPPSACLLQYRRNAPRHGAHTQRRRRAGARARRCISREQHLCH
jgi:hypothetical protein